MQCEAEMVVVAQEAMDDIFDVAFRSKEARPRSWHTKPSTWQSKTNTFSNTFLNLWNNFKAGQCTCNYDFVTVTLHLTTQNLAPQTFSCCAYREPRNQTILPTYRMIKKLNAGNSSLLKDYKKTECWHAALYHFELYIGRKGHTCGNKLYHMSLIIISIFIFPNQD